MMDLTPGELRETTFRNALRGYNVDDVDEFVEGVSAGVEELLEQVRLATERASAAERRAKATVAASEDAMKRTLRHAKKLAEAMVAEARQEARRVVGEARLAAEKTRAGAQEAAEAAAAKAVAARVAEGIDSELQAEVERLHSARRALQQDVAVLTSWMHEQRALLRSGLVETVAALDRLPRPEEPPSTGDVDLSLQGSGDEPSPPEPSPPEPSPPEPSPPDRPPSASDVDPAVQVGGHDQSA